MLFDNVCESLDAYLEFRVYIRYFHICVVELIVSMFVCHVGISKLTYLSKTCSRPHCEECSVWISGHL